MTVVTTTAIRARRLEVEPPEPTGTLVHLLGTALAWKGRPQIGCVAWRPTSRA